MRITMYLIGTLIILGAGSYGALELGVDKVWVGVGAAIVLGLGLMGAASSVKSSGDDDNTTINNNG
jgi:hypothetical protein